MDMYFERKQSEDLLKEIEGRTRRRVRRIIALHRRINALYRAHHCAIAPLRSRLEALEVGLGAHEKAIAKRRAIIEDLIADIERRESHEGGRDD